MPKDEFDFEDPMELNGMAFATAEDTTDLMAECFVEEYMRLGHNHKQVLALFRNSYYIGMHMVLEKRGESFIKNLISEIFARWGRKVDWHECTCGRDHGPKTETASPESEPFSTNAQAILTDPMGAPVPEIKI
jgi:hypothetical protein